MYSCVTPDIYTKNHLPSGTPSKNYKEISCKESIPLDRKHSFQNYGNFIPEAVEYHREK